MPRCGGSGGGGGGGNVRKAGKKGWKVEGESKVYPSKAGAMKRRKQRKMFKHMNEGKKK